MVAATALTLQATSGNVRLVLLLTYLTGAALAVHLLATDVATQSFAWGGAIIAAGLMMAFRGVPRFDMFSPKFFVGMVFVVFYGLGSMLPFVLSEPGGVFTGGYEVALPYYPLAAMVSYFSLLAFWVGYSNGWVRRLGERSRLLHWRYSDRSIALLWSALTATGFLSYLLLIASDAFFTVSSVVHSPLLLSTTGFLLNGISGAIAISIALAVHRRSITWTAAALVVLGARISLGLLTGAKTQILAGIIFAALSWNYAARPFTRGKTALALIVTFMLLLPLMPLNVIYREALAEVGDEGAALTLALEQATRAFTAFGDAAQDDVLFDLAKDYIVARLSNTIIVASILRYQDEGGQLHYGSSYARMLLVFVPRFIWPDKPAATISGALNVEVFGAAPDATVLGVETTITAVGVTMVGELIYNFPVFLAPFGAILIGMCFRWLYEVFRSGLARSPIVAISVYVNWWFILIFSTYESNWASAFNGLITYSLFLMALFWLVGIRPLRTAAL